MVVKTMKELLNYVEEQKKIRAAEHRRKFAHHGECGGLTDKEWNSIKHGQKSSFPKARKFTTHKMWRESNKKFDTQQLIQIAKCTI